MTKKKKPTIKWRTLNKSTGWLKASAVRIVKNKGSFEVLLKVPKKRANSGRKPIKLAAWVKKMKRKGKASKRKR